MERGKNEKENNWDFNMYFFITNALILSFNAENISITKAKQIAINNDFQKIYGETNSIYSN